MNEIFAAARGTILRSTTGRETVRIEQLSANGGAYVTPVKYNRHGIVRAGRSFWTTLHTATWEA